MRLAALYNCFNALELLEKSIEQIYEYVDDIVLCYQTVSIKGEIKPEVEQFIQRFMGRPKYHIVKFKPIPNSFSKHNEVARLQMRIDYAKELGCTHFFSAAEDHFYKPEEFKKAKDHIKNSVFDITITAMYTYYKYPTWQLTPIEDYHMPFICKLYPETKVHYNSNYPVRVDPSIKINTCNSWYLFNEEEIMLHHYSMIRKDIANKFKNAAASVRWKPGSEKRFIDQYKNYDIKINPGVDYFGGRKIKVVDDWAELKF